MTQDEIYDCLNRILRPFLNNCEGEVLTEIDGLLYQASEELAAKTAEKNPVVRIAE
jgi:hypothetical protein